eukprot:PITA_29834
MKMKNISPSALPHFHGLTTEDPDTFLFEFVVLCRTYDYVEDEKKLNLFPSTLKDAALCWFMGLPGNSITTWAQMQQAFNNKYQEYYRSKETEGEIFWMTMGNDEPLEDYEERFQLSYKRARCTLDPESLKLVLLRGVPEDLLDTLHLLAGGGIYQLPYEDIKTMFRNHSRAAQKREETELLGELKQLCVKIPLLHTIKDVPIHNKLIKEKCFRHPGKRKRDAQTINVIGQLSDLILRQVICPKYLDPGSPVVDVHINGTIIPHTLIDLGAAINVMTRDTMLKLNLQSSLRKTSTVLHLADRFTVTPEGILEDVLVSVDSWEYPADFLIL